MIRLEFTFIAFCEVIASYNLLCEHLFMISLTCLRAQLSALVNANLFQKINLNSIDILLCLSVNNSMFFLWYCEGKAVNP